MFEAAYTIQDFDTTHNSAVLYSFKSTARLSALLDNQHCLTISTA